MPMQTLVGKALPVNRFLFVVQAVRQVKKIPVLRHVFFWALYILYAYTLNLFLLDKKTRFLDILCANLLCIWVFYSTYFFCRAALVEKNGSKAILIFLANITVLYAGRYLYMFVLLPEIGLKPFTQFNSPAYIRAIIINFIQFSIFGVGYFYAVRSGQKEKQLRKAQEEKQKIEAERHRLEQHNALLEKQQLQTEHAFLRSQINPHFLQNTLNFFYAKSLGCSEELSSAILTLSEIMRYSLNTKASEAPPLLTDELKQMNNVISINQMRFGNRLQIQFSQTGDTEGIRIMPLVVITLVENAFKHGELNNPDHPVQIALHISAYQESLSFNVSNLKKTGPKEQSHGIGLENIRRRLQLVYGNQASLETWETATNYSITLHIKKLHP